MRNTRASSHSRRCCGRSASIRRTRASSRRSTIRRSAISSSRSSGRASARNRPRIFRACGMAGRILRAPVTSSSPHWSTRNRRACRTFTSSARPPMRAYRSPIRRGGWKRKNSSMRWKHSGASGFGQTRASSRPHFRISRIQTSSSSSSNCSCGNGSRRAAFCNATWSGRRRRDRLFGVWRRSRPPTRMCSLGAIGSLTTHAGG